MASSKRPASRKSIGYLPSPDLDLGIGDKENVGPQAEIANSAMAKQKKTRSKSLGPGGLDALKEDAGNQRKAAAALPKSILKPTIPLSPLRGIPTRKPASESKPTTTPVSPKPSSNNQASPSKKPLNTASPRAASVSPSKPRSIPSPLKPQLGAQDVAAQERQKQRDAIQKHRDARRKSMANRRVSFAPEATLHTFDNLEDLQDSTTSSASTNPTRRGSQVSPRAFAASTTSDTSPSTPTTAGEEVETASSPADNQRDLHQKKRRRRSSGIPPMNFNNPDDALSSSPSFGGEDTTVDDLVEAAADVDSPSKSVVGDDVSISDLMDLDAHTSPEHVRHSGDRDELPPLQQESVEEDDDGQTMEMAGDDITAAFQPWVQQLARPSQSASRFITTLDQENINPFSPAFRAMQTSNIVSPAQPDQDDEGVSMDMTKAIGGIVQQPTLAHGNKTVASRISNVKRRRSSGDSSMFDGDGTMEFTTAIGGIQSNLASQNDVANDENEDLSMEFTSVFGGIHRRKSGMPGSMIQAAPLETVDERVAEDHEDDSAMEMTTAIGGIQHDRQLAEEDTSAMDMTRAIGGIVQDAQPARQPSMTDVADTVSASASNSPKKSPASRGATPRARPLTSTSDTGSPALSNTRSRGRPRKSEPVVAVSTPPIHVKTPQKQMTPEPPRPTTPGKTPPPNVAMRHPSPKRLFQAEIKQARASPANNSPALFDRNDLTGGHTPKIKLLPKLQSKRRTSGIGFDKDGLGSPRVAALLDRRVSIGEQADIFAPSNLESRGVRFEDPRSLEVEVAKERDEDERRESAQFILQHEADDMEADERDATTTLKEAIVSMTPKKGSSKPAKGRKSLAVGSGKGLLGKRPAELDNDDGTPDGLRGREGSPVKKIRLQAPPAASETTRRLFRQSLGPTTGNDRPQTPITQSPPKQTASTPSHSGYFRDVEILPSAQKPLPVLGQASSVDEPEAPTDEEQPKIGLQDFLNMTSIRFMELNTTKRRHTVAPTAGKGLPSENVEEEQDSAKQFEDAVVAGACTLPMLELYQHSCRELKKYISEGRQIVREIEVSTLDENPPLFREYLGASPADRQIMDNQFKNMKTHARHLSKGMWYEWRMKLLEGLREVLVSEATGLQNDSSLLEEQERILDESLPVLLEQHEQLQAEHEELQRRAEELADCDQNELAQARQQLVAAQQETQVKEERLAALKEQSRQLDATLEDAQDAKIENMQAIRAAQRVRAENRGWSSAEVSKLKQHLDTLQTQSGWSITRASSSNLTMTYRDQLSLSFDVAAFSPTAAYDQSQNSPISLAYTADQNEHKPQPLTTEKRFFLQLMRAHLHSLIQRDTNVRDLLNFVSVTWTQCLSLSDQFHRLDLERITHCDILSDERLAVRTMLLIPNVATKVNVSFEVTAVARGMSLDVKMMAKAEVAYGEQYREDKMREFLNARLGEEGIGSGARWADVVRDLAGRLGSQKGRR